MGLVSLQEDIEEAVRLATLVSERLPVKAVSLDVAEKTISGVLRRCSHILATMDEIKKLKTDLSRATQNRIYSLRAERDEAVSRISQLEREVASLRSDVQHRISLERRRYDAKLLEEKKRLNEQFDMARKNRKLGKRLKNSLKQSLAAKRK